MTTTITSVRPTAGPTWDKSKPETRQPWLDFRRPGITATMIRDWGQASKRRQIIDEKVSGEFADLSHLPYVAHGNRREPVIAAWMQGKFGITPCENTFAHPDNPRHLASPDGISTDPFTGELMVGEHAAVLAEIKTSKHDLTPGELDAARILDQVSAGSPFERSGYYTQMQWQMYVMNSPMTLFIYEQHDDVVDPETGTFTPVGPPQWAWIPRNQALIDALVEKVAPAALAEIDAALTSLRVTDLPPASDFPAEDAIHVQEVLKARTTESTAKSSRERAWKILQGKYIGDDKPDFTKDLGFATITVSTSGGVEERGTETYVDEDAMRKRAPKMVADYEALRKRYTKTRPTSSTSTKTQRLTITEKKS